MAELQHGTDAGTRVDNSPPDVNAGELWLLSYYAASELAGGLLLGKLARWTTDADLRARLIWHCAEEMRHAWQWTSTILDLGGTLASVAETYQSRYLAAVGMPRDEIALLTLTQVFETRVAWHLTAHLRYLARDQRVSTTLRSVIGDEQSHLAWIGDRLGQWGSTGHNKQVEQTARRFSAMDRDTYAAEIGRRLEGWGGGELRVFAGQLRAQLSGEHDDGR